MPKTIDSRIMSVILKMSYVRSLHRVICLVLRIEPRLLQYSKCSGSRDKLTLEFMHDFLVVVTTFWEKIVQGKAHQVIDRISLERFFCGLDLGVWQM